MTKKILVTSRSFAQISDTAAAMLETAGFEITYMTKYDRDTFENVVTDYDALIIGAHPFPAELLDRCPKLKIICKHGVGLDNIPLEACKARGVCVTNTPGTNSDAVADYAVLFILASSRNLIYSVNALKNGNLKPKYGTDTHGKTVGLLGFGAIARRVARRLHGFDCKILAYDPYVTAVPEEFSYVTLCSFEDILSAADFISVHLPITDETRGMLGKAEMAKMKKTARIINTARGGIVDEAALYEAVSNGLLAGAALDVLENEPAPADSPLLHHPDVLVTNHVASYSKEALDAVSVLCAENIVRYFNGTEPQHRVV